MAKEQSTTKCPNGPRWKLRYPRSTAVAAIVVAAFTVFAAGKLVQQNAGGGSADRLLPPNVTSVSPVPKISNDLTDLDSLADPAARPIIRVQGWNLPITPNDGKIDANGVPEEKIPEILKKALNPGDRVVKAFPGQGGLTVWVIYPASSPAGSAILYTTPDEKHIVVGSLFGEGGAELRNFTGDYLEAYRPKVDYSKFWSELEGSRWFREGADDKDAKATIYGFFDANCGFCHVGWLGLKPYMDAGLQVRWIPVAVIGLDSDKKAAALMTASNPVATMEAGHAGWAEKQGDAFPSADVTPEVRQALDRHADLMRRVGATGTPAFLYEDPTGAVKLIPGVIRLADIPSITGISEIENKDPRLDNFR